MKFDSFLETVGDWGRFQKFKYIIICLTYMLPPIMVYSYTFTAATPKFRCQNPELKLNDSYHILRNQDFDLKYRPTSTGCDNLRSKISLEECQRCYVRPTVEYNQSNGSQSNTELEKCNEYVFEKVYYQSTLVEEVQINLGFKINNKKFPFIFLY